MKFILYRRMNYFRILLYDNISRASIVIIYDILKSILLKIYLQKELVLFYYYFLHELIILPKITRWLYRSSVGGCVGGGYDSRLLGEFYLSLLGKFERLIRWVRISKSILDFFCFKLYMLNKKKYDYISS